MIAVGGPLQKRTLKGHISVIKSKQAEKMKKKLQEQVLISVHVQCTVHACMWYVGVGISQCAFICTWYGRSSGTPLNQVVVARDAWLNAPQLLTLGAFYPLSACNTEVCIANAMQRAEGFVLERALVKVMQLFCWPIIPLISLHVCMYMCYALLLFAASVVLGGLPQSPSQDLWQEWKG